MSKTSPPPPAALPLYIIDPDEDMRRWLADILSHRSLKIPVLVVGESPDLPLRRCDDIKAVIFNPEPYARDLAFSLTMLISLFGPQTLVIAHHDNWTAFRETDNRITHGFGTRDLARLITLLKSISGIR